MISIVENEPTGGNKPKRTNAIPVDVAQSTDFKLLLDLLALFSDADNRLTQLETEVNEDVLEIIDHLKTQYAKLQQTRTEAEGALELLARKHPEWFTSAKTLKTLYGAVSLKDNPPKLDVPNAEVSMVLIEQAGEEVAKKFLRTHKELDLEALGNLTDAELKQYRISRIYSDTFSVKPNKLDLGKAVAAAAKKEAK